MQVRNHASTKLTLGALSRGDTFRTPSTTSNAGSIWMITENKSPHPDRKNMIRTVSLKTAATAYKSPDLIVIQVKGYFLVTDWGAPMSDILTA